MDGQAERGDSITSCVNAVGNKPFLMETSTTINKFGLGIRCSTYHTKGVNNLPCPELLQSQDMTGLWQGQCQNCCAILTTNYLKQWVHGQHTNSLPHRQKKSTLQYHNLHTFGWQIQTFVGFHAACRNVLLT